MSIRDLIKCLFFFFFQAEDGIRDLVRSRGLGDVYKRQLPILFITASDDDEVFTSETLQIFLASASQKKDLFLVKKADHNNIALVGGEKYYNRISNFINTVLPREPKKTRYKKLAFNDYERNN